MNSICWDAQLLSKLNQGHTQSCNRPPAGLNLLVEDMFLRPLRQADDLDHHLSEKTVLLCSLLFSARPAAVATAMLDKFAGIAAVIGAAPRSAAVVARLPRLLLAAAGVAAEVLFAGPVLPGDLTKESMAQAARREDTNHGRRAKQRTRALPPGSCCLVTGLWSPGLHLIFGVEETPQHCNSRRT